MVIRSYVGQPLIDNECKNTVMLQGKINDNIIHDIIFEVPEYATDAIYYMDDAHDIFVTSAIEGLLLDCGYGIHDTIATRTTEMSAWVAEKDKRVTGVVMCSSRYEAMFLLKQYCSYTTMNELHEGDVLIRTNDTCT